MNDKANCQLGTAGVLSFFCAFGLAVDTTNAAPVEVIGEGDSDATELEARFGPLPGATLRTDSETADLLARADQFAKQGRYDLASTLWQTVIDSSNDLVFTRPEWIDETLEHAYQRYRSVTGDIEGTLGVLPDKGLEGYRIKADGEAKRLLARPGDDGREAALAEVVRRYFLSSVGDDAAFELACRKLDRYEFLPAIRLLAKVAEEYPAPSVEKDEVMLRMAALSGRVGDRARALEILADLRARVTPSVPDEVIDLVEADVKKTGDGTTVANVDADAVWPMTMGGPRRIGLMPSPESVPNSGGFGAEAWAQPWSLIVPEGWPELRKPKERLALGALNPDDPFRVQIQGRRTQPKKPSTTASRLADWPRHGWYPSARVLFAGGRIYFKNGDRLVCADATSGELNWLGFRNEYPLPPAFTRARTYSRTESDDSPGRAPRDDGEVQAFGDSVHQSMCVVRDKVLTLQGKPIDFTEDNVPHASPPQRVVIHQAGATDAARYRDNRLVAYHARNGKLQWTRHAAEESETGPKRSCFAGSPVPYGGLVLIPVLEERGMFLTAIDAEGGATLWRTFLGDEPEATAPGSAIMIAVDGGEAYVATGAGLVFSVDAISGSMNWAVRYPRTPDDPSAVQRQAGFGGFRSRYQQVVRFDGWNEEMLVPVGNTLIVTPVDFNHVIAFDRRSGTLMWESARKPGGDASAADYALGVRDGKFYVAGNDVVRCYRASGGRMLWEFSFPAGHGRGALVEDGIYMPSGDSKVLKIVEKMDADGVLRGEVETEFSVEVQAPVSDEDKDASGDEEAATQPVGNLYSDGSLLFGVGLERAYAITELDEAARDARAAEREQAKVEKMKAVAEALAKAGEDLPDDLDGLGNEFETILTSMPEGFGEALRGEDTKMEVAMLRLEAMAAKLGGMPDPPADVVAANRERFKAIGAKVGLQIEALAEGVSSDDKEKLKRMDELVTTITTRGEALEATFERFGFENE